MRSRWLRPVLALIAAGLIVWLVVLLLDDDGVSLTPGEPQLVSVAQLESFADDAPHPVYWLGERPGVEYELSEAPSGRVFVRYLPDGAAAGEGEGEFLMVGTYPVEDGAAALRRAAREAGRELGRSDGGAVVLIDAGAANNAHLAYPGEDLQVEIFSPVPGQALRLASRDRARPVP